MERGNAKLYGIRFNLDHQASSASPTDCQWWLTPYAWLEKDDQWYLIKVFTPWFANLFPRFITKFPHKAWKVTPDEVLNNDIFRLHEYHKPDKNYAAVGFSGAAAGYSGIGALPFLMLGLFLPSHNHLSFFPAYLIYVITILSTLFIMKFLFKTFNLRLFEDYRKLVINYPELESSINNITNNNQELEINILKIKAFNILMLIRKILFVIYFCAFFLPITYTINENSTALVVVNGITMAVWMYICIFYICFSYSPRDYLSNHINKIVVSKIE